MQNNINTPLININDLTNRLISEDKRNAKMTRRLLWMYSVMGIAYLLVYLFSYIFDKDDMTKFDIISGTCYTLAFLLFALIFKRYNKEYRDIDYSLPTLEMLKKAAFRYKFLHKRLYYAMIPVFLIDIGFSLSSGTHTSSSFVTSDIISSQIIFISCIGVGILAGTLLWYIRQKPLRDNALTLIKELEQ